MNKEKPRLLVHLCKKTPKKMT